MAENDAQDEMIRRLSECKTVLVTTHVRPDGDAIGTSAAMVLGLRQKGIEAHVLLLSRSPKKYEFVLECNQIKTFVAEPVWPADLDLDVYDALLVVDTGTWSQLPGVKEHMGDFKKPKLVLDHHLTQEDWADAKLVVTTAAAAGEIACELLSGWGIDHNQAVAEALLIAITSDTGWFQFANTTPHTFRMAASLLEAGADMDRVYQLVYQSESAPRLGLQTRVLESLQLLAGGRLAVMSLGPEDFAAAGATVMHTENFINIPMQVKTVQVSMLAVQSPGGGPIRISLRSKGQLDVARFAEQFGGGGHARASGLKLDGPLKESMKQVTDALLKSLEAMPEQVVRATPGLCQ